MYIGEWESLMNSMRGNTDKIRRFQGPEDNAKKFTFYPASNKE